MSSLNVGNLDRVLRILLGLALIVSAAIGAIGAWGFLGVAPLVIGIVASCPMYRLLGLRTTAR